jgi:hypothetical protein
MAAAGILFIVRRLNGEEYNIRTFMRGDKKVDSLFPARGSPGQYCRSADNRFPCFPGLVYRDPYSTAGTVDGSPATPGKVGVLAFEYTACTTSMNFIFGFSCKGPGLIICFKDRHIVIYNKNRNIQKRDIFPDINTIPGPDPGITGFTDAMRDRGVRPLAGPDGTITERTNGCHWR